MTKAKKALKKVADRTLGYPMRSIFRNLFIRPIFWLKFKTTIKGGNHALECPDGALVVAEHVSYLDGPFLMNAAWRFAFVWATMWWAEYKKMRFLAWMFKVVKLGSPSHPPGIPPPPDKKEHAAEYASWGARYSAEILMWGVVRAESKARAMESGNRILRAGGHLLVFAQGGIKKKGEKTVVASHLTGVHDWIRDNPEKPILIVRIKGLEHWKKWWRWRIPVTVTLSRFDNVDISGGPAALNKHIEDVLNGEAGAQLPTLKAAA